MKKLIKNISIVGLLLLGVACKGPNGGPGMSMTSCDVNKEEVKQILTGSSKNCSGLVSSAMTTEEAELILQDTFLTEDGAVVTIKEDVFWSIFDAGTKVIALRGKIELTEDNTEGDETLKIKTLLDEMTMAEGTITFGEEITMTVHGETLGMSAYEVKSNLNLNDSDIIVVTNPAELAEAFNQL